MGQQIEFPSNGGPAEGYVAVPESGSGPGVIVIQEWWGLVPHISDVVDRFAREGFVALAPDLYHGRAATEPDEAQKLAMSLELDRAANDIAGAAAYLTGRDETASDGVGVVGFCMGGTLALWTPTVSPDVAVSVGFYPAPFRGWDDLDTRWRQYADKAAQIHTADSDGGSNSPHVQQAMRAIQHAGGSAESYDYPGTQHAFFNDHRPAHDPEASERAWDRTLAFFRARLAP